jgi:hypothetical protein
LTQNSFTLTQVKNPSPEATCNIVLEDSSAFPFLNFFDPVVLWSQSSGLSFTEAARGVYINPIEDATDLPAYEALWQDLLSARGDIA